jgi:pyruvate dehydrogenase E2 component (dihydrolipoamide acetyltransferase)
MRISPAARARAAALGIDVATLKATGPDGAVTLRDVDAAVRATAPPSQPGTGMRHAIATAMSRAKREIPHYYLQLEMDLGPTLQWLEAHNAAVPVPERLLLAALQVKAVALACAQKPGFSGWFGQDGFAPAPAVNVGVAIALRGGGLIAPAIADTSHKTLAAVMQELQDLVARVRRGRLRSTEISSATISVTSLGDEGVDTLWPIIQPPQVAIVGFGSPLERPWVVGREVAPRPVMHISLAADHRVSDGRQGAQFLARVRELLATPAEL